MTQKEYLETIETVIENGRFKADWASLSNHKTPSWYYRDKFGIFIHWGIYSVPAFAGEWYSRNMYNKPTREYFHHIKHYGPQSEFGYKDFIPMFKGENFDAEEWATLFKNAGARFVTPVCEHHDGFAMYDTEFNKWNAKNMGPCRDVIGEIKAACENNGLTFCGSTHRAEHYFFMNPGRSIDSDVNDDTYRDFYGPAVEIPVLMGMETFKSTEDTYAEGASEEWLNDWLVRTCELIDKY
ncbi:MAG: alpha-L-fucosidase, partial [Eubacterium sp.]|nr:alpha-L-fucosidase [Eubacterium sp.]